MPADYGAPYDNEQTVPRGVPILRHELEPQVSCLPRGVRMSYQGARARSQDDETRRVFAVSKVRLSEAGSVTDVLWAEINAKSNLDIGVSVIVPVSDVIDAIHDGAQVSAVFPVRFGAMPDHTFEVIEFTNGFEAIDLVASRSTGPEGRVHLKDLARLDD